MAEMEPTKFVCPVCSGILLRGEKTLCCANNHSYDLSKHGTVNLLMSQQSSDRRHGDDKLMVSARRAFLEKGCYSPLRELVAELCLKHGKKAVTILDIGCGECWYTAGIKRYLEDNGVTCEVYGVDISKEAVIAGAKRDKSLSLAVASVAALPFADESFDLLINVFAPYEPAELRRVMKQDGSLIIASPLERHLFGLKAAVYDKPLLNPPAPEYREFTVKERRELKYTITLESNEDIESLFAMTPYYYKTGINDQKKLEKLTRLVTETEFDVAVLGK